MKLQPLINKDLIEHFEVLFPNVLPTKQNITTEEIAFLQGQQSVINRMKYLYDDDIQNDEV